MRDSKGRFIKGFTPANKGTHQWFICKNCNKNFYPQDTVRRIYCSKKCYYIRVLNNPTVIAKRANSIKGKKRTLEQKLKVTGQNHYNWQGGITPENDAQRVRFRREIQKQVFERDNYTCQFCNIKGEILHVDHIQPWAEYVEGRFDINNCRTLCIKCHYKITFGYEMPIDSKWGITFMKGDN